MALKISLVPEPGSRSISVSLNNSSISSVLPSNGCPTAQMPVIGSLRNRQHPYLSLLNEPSIRAKSIILLSSIPSSLSVLSIVMSAVLPRFDKNFAVISPIMYSPMLFVAPILKRSISDLFKTLFSLSSLKTALRTYVSSISASLLFARVRWSYTKKLQLYSASSALICCVTAGCVIFSTSAVS